MRVEEKLLYLAQAVIELSDNVEDRDGLSNHAEIAVDVARGVINPNWLQPASLRSKAM